MAKKLQDKIRKNEEEHAAEVVQEQSEHLDRDFENKAWEVRGAMRAVSAITNSLLSQHMRGLMHIEDMKYWRVYKFDSFADYLNRAEESGLSKSRYYELREVLLNSSDEVLDAVTGAKISPRKIKALLSAGVEMSVEDGQLKIGEESVEVSDTRTMSRIVEGFHQTLTDRDEREKKHAAKIEKLETQLKQGQKDFDELRRRLNEHDSTPRFERTIMRLVGSFLTMIEAVGELDEGNRKERGKEDLQLVAGLYFRLSDTYGVKVPFSKNKAADDLIDRALADIDMEDLD